MTVVLLCPVTGCRARGRHNTDCTNNQCAGCQPRTAADYSQLCRDHSDQLHEQLTELPQLVDDVNDPLLVIAYHHTHTPHGWVELPPDPVSLALPAGPVPSTARGSRVSGTNNHTAPTNLDRVDLTAHHHPKTPLTDQARQSRRHDQTGYASTADRLVEWVDAILEQRGDQEPWPTRTTPALTTWILGRYDWILLHHNHIHDLSWEVNQLHRQLLTITGQTTLIHRLDAPCPSCDLLTLIRKNGSDYVECTLCGLHWNENQYQRLAVVAAHNHAV